MAKINIISIAAAILLVLLGIYALIAGYQAHHNFKNDLSAVGTIGIALGFALLLHSGRALFGKMKKRT
jgi:uncharacterized membrane protein